MSRAAGIDIGSTATKAVVVKGDGAIMGRAILRSGTDFAGSAEAAYAQALTQAGLEHADVESVFTCGYGRKNVEFANETKTEIACHATGAYYYFPTALTIVDIGGQDNKIIKVNAAGQRTSFKMNRKCAAGTGAFLEEMSLRLGVPLSDFDGMAARAAAEASLGAFCTVFTATEVLAKIREGVPVENLIKGLFRSVVKRVREMEIISDTVVATGGVAAHNPYLITMMSQEFGCRVETPPYPQFTGAHGAALFALRSLEPKAA